MTPENPIKNSIDDDDEGCYWCGRRKENMKKRRERGVVIKVCEDCEPK